MWFSQRTIYHPLRDQESKPFHQDNSSSESLPSPPRPFPQDDHLPRRYWKYLLCLSIANILILTLSTFLFLVWYTSRQKGRNALMRATSFYSPILDRLEIPTSIQTMNATLYPGPEPGFARQYPNAEADAIWDELELLRTIPITREDVLKLGKDPNIVAKFEDDYWGLGDDAYMAQLDVFHQLHCLNQLRQLIYPEYYGFNASTLNHPDLWYVHLNHCVDILAQNIMCTANTDLYTLNWMETQGYPFPDFNINHQCRDFGALLEWRKENGVDIDMWVAMEKPANVNQIPAPQEILDLIQHEFVVHESHNLEVE